MQSGIELRQMVWIYAFSLKMEVGVMNTTST